VTAAFRCVGTPAEFLAALARFGAGAFTVDLALAGTYEWTVTAERIDRDPVGADSVTGDGRGVPGVPDRDVAADAAARVAAMLSEGDYGWCPR
jgi:hypothetical protein